MVTLFSFMAGPNNKITSLTIMKHVEDRCIYHVFLPDDNTKPYAL